MHASRGDVVRKLLCIIFLMLSVSPAVGRELRDKPGQLIRVGVFSNPPVVLQDESGQWHGITVDILRAIAEDKGWKLEFHPGSFADNLEMLENDQIDLLSTMAYSEQRAEKYTFNHSPLISNWGLIYIRPGTKVGSLLDLENKHVAVMRNNIHDKAFRNLATKFDVKLTIVDRDNFSDVMESVRDGSADAGVANRLFGALHASKYGLVETGVIFNPINIHYATLHSKNAAILEAIDKKLNLYKDEKGSVYYKTLQYWLNPTGRTILPIWLKWLALVVVAVITLMIGLNLLLRRQVATRTLQLQNEVDERRLAQERLDRLAYYDVLTGLPNRVSFLENLKTSTGGARRRGLKVAVMFIDMDRFKTVNDSLGHDVGDKLIVSVARLLQGCLREEDHINRFGGDEFVIILTEINNLSDVSVVADRMLECFSTPFHIGLAEIYSSISIGIALFPDDGGNDSLLRYADTAMYHAKEQGGNNYQFYNSDFTDSINNRLSLETRLRHAVERDELRLHYQPILNISNQCAIGVEALIRWQDPERGMIPPDEFIPLAEDTGLIVPFGKWVLEKACTQVREWENMGLGKLRLAVNISSRQFIHNDLLADVDTALQKSGLAPQQLELEITERMFLEITDNVREVLESLKRKGVSLSMDDFGTGYSSLSYLKQLPIDTLKIDKSFVMGIPDDKDDMRIATTIISMAHGLGLDVVAEGIETKEQMDFLQSHRCGRGQGYYIARPQATEEITAWLRDNKK